MFESWAGQGESISWFPLLALPSPNAYLLEARLTCEESENSCCGLPSNEDTYLFNLFRIITYF